MSFYSDLKSFRSSAQRLIMDRCFHPFVRPSVPLPFRAKQWEPLKEFLWNFKLETYAYWTVHHLDVWIKVDQLDGSAYTQIPHHQQPILPRNTSTPQVSLHNTTRTR